jgi:Ser/Thr protein kinase RdoA (MazF antagonist)
MTTAPEAAFRRAAERACASFGFGSGFKLLPLSTGHTYVYRVDAPHGRFLLRLLSPSGTTAGTIAVLASWLASVSAGGGVGVPDPVALPDGSWHLEVAVEGEPAPRPCMLLRWVEGERCPTPAAFVEAGTLRAVGAAVARLHRHSEGFRPPPPAAPPL